MQALLIGGSSGTGKTTLAHELGRLAGVDVVSLDSLRRGPLEERLARASTWEAEPAAVAALLWEAGERFPLPDALRPGAVLEGERVLPAAAARAGVPAVFLVEDDASALRSNLERKSAGFPKLPVRVRDAVVRADLVLGGRIAREARRLGFPVVPSRPWRSLPDRVLQSTAWP